MQKHSCKVPDKQPPLSTAFTNNACVSVVVPLYNAPNTILLALDSIRTQTALSEIREVIVIDDGSEDESGNLVLAFAKTHPKFPLRYLRVENRGVSAARNLGIKTASGEFIALLDSDELWLKEKLEKQLKVLREHPDIVFLGAAHQTIPLCIKIKRIRTLYKASLAEIFFSYFPATSSVIFRRDAIQTVGLFDEQQKYSEDINFFMRFAVHFNYYYLPEKLVEIDIGKKYPGASGLSSNLPAMHRGEMKNLKELYEGKAIGIFFYLSFYLFLELKYVRRIVKHTLQRLAQELSE